MNIEIRILLILFFLSYISPKTINFYGNYQSINGLSSSETFIIYFSNDYSYFDSYSYSNNDIYI